VVIAIATTRITQPHTNSENTLRSGDLLFADRDQLVTCGTRPER
jgi:hypothetical protein